MQVTWRNQLYQWTKVSFVGKRTCVIAAPQDRRNPHSGYEYVEQIEKVDLGVVLRDQLHTEFVPYQNISEIVGHPIYSLEMTAEEARELDKILHAYAQILIELRPGPRKDETWAQFSSLASDDERRIAVIVSEVGSPKEFCEALGEWVLLHGNSRVSTVSDATPG